MGISKESLLVFLNYLTYRGNMYYNISGEMWMLENFSDLVIDFVYGLGILGPILGCLFIIVESILPVLPLFVFVSLNFLVFGDLLGMVISWVFTILGCIFSFLIFRYKVRNVFNSKLRNKEIIDNLMGKIDKMPLKYLAVIMALPFTPAFAVNIAGGLSKLSLKKFIVALVIGKWFMIYFWGFVGTSILDGFKDPMVFVKVGLLLGAAYVASTLVNRKLNID